MWKKHLVHGDSMYYEERNFISRLNVQYAVKMFMKYYYSEKICNTQRNIYCMEELLKMLWMCFLEYKYVIRGGNI